MLLKSTQTNNRFKMNPDSGYLDYDQILNCNLIMGLTPVHLENELFKT